MIAFIGAMSCEVEALTKLMTSVEHKRISNIDFYEGLLSNQLCVVMQSGIAKVAAALSTTVLLEHFDISGIVNIGTAGGLCEQMNVLDVVIATKVAHHDLNVPFDGWEKHFEPGKVCYLCDEQFVKIATSITEENKDIVWIGPIISGDSFIQKQEGILLKQQWPEALCAEMEAAAIGQVCTHYNVPFIVIRSLSDIVHHDNNSMTFEEYALLASERSAKWCKLFIEQFELNK